MEKTKIASRKALKRMTARTALPEEREKCEIRAIALDRAVVEAEIEEKNAKKELHEAFQKVLDQERRTDNIAIQAATDYLKAGDYDNALATLSRQLSREDVQEDLNRYRRITNRIIELLESPDIKAYDTAAAIAQKRVDYERALARKEVREAQKQVRNYGRYYVRKTKELAAKARQEEIIRAGNEDTLEAFVAEHFSQK